MEKPTYNREQALQNLQDFMEDHPLEDFKDNLYQLYKGWMLTNVNKVDGDDVLNMLLFYDELKAFVEQVYLIRETAL